jgi:2-polyprenyl-3-methyl-5-hydroxy-6-metoxy-1,4-benzoquinol methylase
MLLMEAGTTRKDNLDELTYNRCCGGDRSCAGAAVLCADNGGGEAGRRDALAERLLESLVHTAEVAAVYLGDRLGFYEALVDLGPATPAEVAARAHTHERYTREWLEQQAVAGFVEAANPRSDARERRYCLPQGHAEVLLDQDSLSWLAPFARQFVGSVRQLPAILEAFRTGDGVPWHAYGPDVREGQADGNRPAFLHQLASEWFPAVPDVHARLMAEPPARVADIGCGAGWSSIAIAEAYPLVSVDGFDSDAPAIAMARAHAEQEESLAGRVQFYAGDAAGLGRYGSYDLVTVFEAVHDMAQPVAALRAAREMLAPGGSIIVMDERVPEVFEAPGDLIDRLFYGFSILLCLPATMAEQPSAGTGTVMRPDTLRRYALEAGLTTMEILPVDHPLWRFYRLTP